MKKRTILYSLLAAVVLCLDFLMKRYILSNFRQGEIFGAIPFVADLIYVRNTGAAFSILSGRTQILSILSVIFCIAAAVYWVVKKPSHPLLCSSVALLFSGALGNAIDRLAYGFVVDFISIVWFDFPVFNIADMAIVTGAILLVVYEIFFDKEQSDGHA